MTVLATVLGVNAVAATTSSTPLIGSINSFNASSGALTPVLPQLVGLNTGASLVVEKNFADTSINPITVTAYTGDTFDDSTTSLTLYQAGERCTLQVVTPTTGNNFWKIVQRSVVFKKLVGSVVSTATPTFSTDGVDCFKITALATGITGWSISGSPTDREELTITIKDNGTPQAISWLTTSTIDFLPSGVASLPNVTSAGRKMTLKFVYDADNTSWMLMAADINGY